MKMRYFTLALSVSILGCGYLRSLLSDETRLEEDTSIVFPRFFERAPVEVGSREMPYELDGEMLRALVRASNDYIPQDDGDATCPNRKEAQLYRVIRQGSIIFVYIYENHVFCGRPYPMRHSGARYAISTEGRILRRLLGGPPEVPAERSASEEDGGHGDSAEPGVSPAFEAQWNQARDGGSARVDGPAGGDAGL